MDFKVSDNRYKPQPIWLWNSKLNIDETTLRADRIKSAGFGGFSVGPSSGLSTTYLSDEWFRNLSAALKSAADNSMESWICDEMPGFLSYSKTSIDSKGLEFQQKFLRLESGEKTNERTIIFSDGCHFYYDVNPFSIDVYNEDSASLFINEAYLPYLSKTHEKFTGFMLDTSAYFTEDIPWSFSFPAEYKNTYGEELLDVLAELFRPVGNYKSTRYKFWSLVANLFETRFLKPIYDWCNENELQLTLINHGGVNNKSFINAFSMTKSRYSHIPCVVAESSEDISPANALMTSSVMHQFGKNQSAAILYSSIGHSRTLEEIKHMAQQYLVRGINKIIPASLSYSLEGFRKNTVSTPFICQNFRKDENNYFNNCISTVSKILTEGNADFDTLLIHNQTSALKEFDTTASGDDILLTELESTINKLEKKHIPFHIGDEILLEKTAYVKGNQLIVGNKSYSTVVLTENPVLSESTSRLLSEFECGGGFIVMADSLPDSDICDNENLLYTYRSFPDCKIHYFVNNSSDSFTASIPRGSKIADASTGETLPFFGIYKFSAYESMIVIDDGTPQLSRPYNKPLKELDISGLWEIEFSSLNSLLIDKCDVYIDDVLTYEDIDAGSVTELLCQNGNSVKVRCDYKFHLSDFKRPIYLSNESHDISSITVNGTPVAIIYDEPHPDDLFSRINIAPFVNDGENIISISASFSNNDKFLSLYEKASAYETELNKIRYEKDLSPLILSGDFSVLCDCKVMKLDKGANRFVGNFAITDKISECSLTDIEKCGFPFFAGSITFRKTINLSDTLYCIRFLPKAVRSISVEVNGEKLPVLCCSPYECDISPYLVKGDNEVKITITSNMRNLFGPHHIPVGELYKVSPGHYYKHPCTWNRNTETPWNENYCLVEFGIERME